MGVDTERFVDNLPQEALCSLCCLILKEPVRSPCGHYICSACWDRWRRGPSGEVCPYCCEKISSSESVKRSQTVWKLLLNFNVHCPYHKAGCTAIYKLGLEEQHLKRCPFNNDNGYEKDYLGENESITTSSNNCRKCQHTLDLSQKHDCISLLQKTVRTQQIQIANLEYENDRLSLRLTTKENSIMDQLIDVENRYQQDALNYELEIRELRTKTAALEGELKNRIGETEEVDLTVILERQNGSLGLNIIGGEQEGKHASGIFISRIAEGGPASKPGKLQLNDRVLEVNEFNLRSASHEDAVHAFKNSHGPIRMLVRRSVVADRRKCNVATQTESKLCDLTDSALMSGSEAEESLLSISENVKPGGAAKTDFYDSAYDTLMTQKSSRSHRTYSLDESVSPVKESQDGSSESCDDVRTLTPSTVVNGYCSSSQNSKMNSTLPPSGSIANDSHSPVHEVKLRRNSNGDNSSPRKVIRRSTYFLVDESIDGSSFSSILNSLSGESKVSGENSSTATSLSNDLDVEYEYEYEEVILKRTTSSFGITMCYGGDEDDLGVYIGKIESDSAADKNGRIFVGDQVVQLNNTQIRCVEDATKMLHHNDSLKLLLARPVHEGQMVNGFKSDLEVSSQLSSLREMDNENELKADLYRASSGLKEGATTNTEFSPIEGNQHEISTCTENKASKSGCFESGFESMVDCNKNMDSSKKSEKKSELREDVKLTLKDYVLSRLRGQDKGRSKGQESDYSSQSEVSRERTLERKNKKDNDCETPKISKKDYCKDSLSKKEKRDTSSGSASGSPARLSDNPASPSQQVKVDSPVRSAMKKRNN